MEKTLGTKIASVASASVLLIGSGAALATMPAESALANDSGAATVLDAETAGTTAVIPVTGTFTFDQEATTPTNIIREVFTKASAALCASMPQYDAAGASQDIVVTGPDGSALGTVDELTDDETTVTVGCACASNAAGGGAIANAGVSGTTLAALVAAITA